MPRMQPIMPALAVLALSLTVGSLPRNSGAATTLTVTTTADLASPCTPSAFSLRCAFDQANKDGGGDTIAFTIPVTDPGCVKSVIQQTTVAVCTISPLNTHFQGGLPALFVNNSTINGYTQPGARPNTNPMGQGDNAIIAIRLDGARGEPFVGDGIQIFGSGNTVRGLSITNFTTGMGLRIDQGFHNTAAGNFLGIAPDGKTGGTSINNVDLEIRTGSDTVGGTNPADTNVIGGGPMLPSGGSAGVYINAGVPDTPGSGANDVIVGNYIGTNAAGTAALGNGVGIKDAAGITITIGGTSQGARNIISGNAIAGIDAGNGTNQFGGVIAGNYIGTNAAGTAALGNGPLSPGTGYGVEVTSDFIVGGTSAAARNLISGNVHAGLLLFNGSANNVIVGNAIGTNAAGSAALGNGAGIAIIQQFTLAGPTSHNILARNLISGNAGNGIDDQSPGTGNIIARNRIGLSATGAVLGNGGNGVSLVVQGNLVPGAITDAVVGNTIMHNTQSGVLVGPRTHSRISRNAFAANGGLGIDLAPQGVVNCTGPAPGPNDNTPCPIITTATTTTISGTACVTCTVEVYRASNEADDLGHGEGALFLGGVTANSAGAWSLNLPAGKVMAGQQVTASATTQATPTTPAETSEFGANVTVGP